MKLTIIRMNEKLIERLSLFIEAFRQKGKEFTDVIKMRRIQLQDAVPMALGQEFEVFAVNLEEEITHLRSNAKLFLEIDMGSTIIGTGLNAPEGYARLYAQKLATLTGKKFVTTANLVEATPDTDSYVIYSSALERMAVKLSKACNDLRLLPSGSRTDLNEINLPKIQSGSSIASGKIDPVTPEAINQVCFKVIGNDLAVAFAAEAGRLQLNVMEPVLCQRIIESAVFSERAVDALRTKCTEGITANCEACLNVVKHSIGIVTALNPHIEYKNSSKIAKEASGSGKSIYNLVLEHKLLSKEELDGVLDPKNMI